MGILLVYDITSEKSFDSIRNWIRNIEEHASSDVERMLIGNKCDMNDRRQVSKERGEKLAIEYGMKCMETSAKLNENIENAFFTLARDIKAKTEKRLVRRNFFFVGLIKNFLKFFVFNQGQNKPGDNNSTKVNPNLKDTKPKTSFFSKCTIL